MPTDLIQPATSLGVAGFAMLLLWMVYKDCMARLDRKDEAFRELEREVRTEITTALVAATSTIAGAQKVMERVLDKLSR